MEVKNISKEMLKKYYKNLENYVKSNNDLKWVKYLDLGVKVIRLMSYSDEFTPLVEKQLTYTLKDKASHYDATIILWKENDIKNISLKIDETLNPRTNFKARIEMLASKRDFVDLHVFDDSYSKTRMLLDVNAYENIVNAFDRENNTYYYGVENLEPEEFIKHGHIFVQMFNLILNTKESALVHGAVVGLDNHGILFCAGGQRGKSTLTVLSMLKGFEYVSDDYLTLYKSGNELLSSPIYSIITLSPRMYNELYDELDGTRFVSNNARKDKYVLNIANHHNQFKTGYPIKFCMFPQIVNDAKPSIVPCDKEMAIDQLITSTTVQMQDSENDEVKEKLRNFIKDFDFYQINLCSDIYANTEFLREFTKKKIKEEKKNNELCIK